MHGVFSTPEQAKVFLHENKKVWDKLAKVMSTNSQDYSWRVFFRYHMMAIVTQSNQRVPEVKYSDGNASHLLKFVDPNLDEVC